VGVVLIAGTVLSFVAAPGLGLALILARVLLIATGIFVLVGLYMLQPREAAIMTLFGEYRGTDRSEGLRWANPLYHKRKISLRARNLNAPTLKVNDKRGNPIEISAVVVWRVQDTARRCSRWTISRTTCACRPRPRCATWPRSSPMTKAKTWPRARPRCAAGERGVRALRMNCSSAFEAAGVAVDDAKLSHLAYAPEIAQVMLRRQQAEAIISARTKIVQGAVAWWKTRSRACPNARSWCWTTNARRRW
jgi:hypothetical protein